MVKTGMTYAIGNGRWNVVRIGLWQCTAPITVSLRFCAAQKTIGVKVLSVRTGNVVVHSVNCPSVVNASMA